MTPADLIALLARGACHGDKAAECETCRTREEAIALVERMAGERATIAATYRGARRVAIEETIRVAGDERAKHEERARSEAWWAWAERWHDGVAGIECVEARLRALLDAMDGGERALIAMPDGGDHG